LLNNLNLTLILKTGEYGELLIMPENGRWDLIRRLKVNYVMQNLPWKGDCFSQQHWFTAANLRRHCLFSEVHNT